MSVDMVGSDLETSYHRELGSAIWNRIIAASSREELWRVVDTLKLSEIDELSKSCPEQVTTEVFGAIVRMLQRSSVVTYDAALLVSWLPRKAPQDDVDAKLVTMVFDVFKKYFGEKTITALVEVESVSIQDIVIGLTVRNVWRDYGNRIDDETELLIGSYASIVYETFPRMLTFFKSNWASLDAEGVLNGLRSRITCFGELTQWIAIVCEPPVVLQCESFTWLFNRVARSIPPSEWRASFLEIKKLAATVQSKALRHAWRSALMGEHWQPWRRFVVPDGGKTEDRLRFAFSLLNAVLLSHHRGMATRDDVLDVRSDLMSFLKGVVFGSKRSSRYKLDLHLDYNVDMSLLVLPVVYWWLEYDADFLTVVVGGGNHKHGYGESGAMRRSVHYLIYGREISDKDKRTQFVVCRAEIDAMFKRNCLVESMVNACRRHWHDDVR